jgi:hypothetical protein
MNYQVLLAPFLAYTSTLKLEAKCSSEISFDFNQTTLPHIPEDRTFEDVCMKTEILVVCLYAHILSIIFILYTLMYEVSNLISCPLLPLSLMSFSIWLKHPVLRHLIGLFPLVFNSDTLSGDPSSIHFYMA